MDKQPFEFEYRLLSRLKSDCEYFLGHGNRCEKHLWAGGVDSQIKKMKELWEMVPEKPEWLPFDEIIEYEKAMKGSNNMDKINIDELNERLKNKTTLSPGNIYEMFGAKYITVANTEGRNPCDMCAFSKCSCMLNVDIPSCNNDVHFELIKDIKLVLLDCFGDTVATVESINNNTVRTKDGKTYDMVTLYRGDYSIAPMIVKR
jgi:hypothetical protein